jgi:hypothetical protein
MKILKDLSRKEFRSNFGEKHLCLSFLSTQKWAEEFSCFKYKNTKFSNGKKHIIDVVVNADMMNSQQQTDCFIKLSLVLQKPLKWHTIWLQVKKWQIVFGWQKGTVLNR